MDSLPPQGTPDICYSQNGIWESWTLISVCVFRLFYDVSFMICEQWIRGDLEVICQGLIEASSRNLLCRGYWNIEEHETGYWVSQLKFKLSTMRWAIPQHQPAHSLIPKIVFTVSCDLKRLCAHLQQHPFLSSEFYLLSCRSHSTRMGTRRWLTQVLEMGRDQHSLNRSSVSWWPKFLQIFHFSHKLKKEIG
jgi:hypothetical protein